MNDTPTISVIVPMYNAEKYLQTCINSILNQTFTDFELILVNNCSTDRSLEIAKSFSDPRIKILQTEKNSGSPGTPRNLGIDSARGEFLYFMDSDDAITIRALELLHNKIIETGADIVYCNTWMIPDDSEFTDLKGLNGISMSTPGDAVSKDIKRRIWFELCKNYMNSVLWLCLYRRKLFDDGEEKIRFPDYYLAEDVFVHFDLLCATDNIVKINTPFYVYRTNLTSLTRSKKNVIKALESMFALNTHVRNKLTKLTDDERFINNTCLSLMNGVSSIYFLPLYKENPTETFHELEKFFQKHFDSEVTNLTTILFAYLWGQNESIKRTNFRSELQSLIDKNP